MMMLRRGMRYSFAKDLLVSDSAPGASRPSRGGAGPGPARGGTPPPQPPADRKNTVLSVKPAMSTGVQSSEASTSAHFQMRSPRFESGLARRVGVTVAIGLYS